MRIIITKSPLSCCLGTSRFVREASFNGQNDREYFVAVRGTLKGFDPSAQNHVIDYTREDFTKSGQHYDLIFDLVANHSFSARRRVLNPRGIYIGAGVLAGPSMMGLVAGLITDLVLSRFVSQTFVTFMAKLSKEELTILGELMEAGKVTPVIDRR